MSRPRVRPASDEWDVLRNASAELKGQGIKALVEKVYEIAAAMVEWMPQIAAVFVGIGPGGAMAVLEAQWDDASGKAHVFDMMREVMPQIGVTQYAFVTEAYMARAETKEDMKTIEKNGASRHPGRIEVLLVDGWDNKGDNYQVTGEIGPDRKVKRIEWQELSLTRGQGVNLLKSYEEANPTEH